MNRLFLSPIFWAILTFANLLNSLIWFSMGDILPGVVLLLITVGCILRGLQLAGVFR